MDTNKKILCVMAAGMGSRFGGLKQIEPVGPNGEIIIDYSVYDAKKAGFNKAVFIIKKAIEKDFREAVGKRIEKIIDVDYAFQEIEKIPEKYVPSISDERTKPWGTAHAILCAEKQIDAPFVTINADDYYGKDAYAVTSAKLSKQDEEYGLAGFVLKNTLSENGTVARGVCAVNKEGYLEKIDEITKINPDMSYDAEDGKHIVFPEDTVVSMNMWALRPSIFSHLEEGLHTFLEGNVTNPKAEYFLPIRIGELVGEGKAKVEVLPCKDRWYGVTYKADMPEIQEAMIKYHGLGMYDGI